jgi:enoyl-CoA hydratase
VPHGQARVVAEALAAEIAALPQTCVRSDRESTLASLSLSEAGAMASELRCGQVALADPGLAAEIARFRGGAGRGGA